MSACVLALLLAAVPPGKVPSRETAEAGLVRYESIAEDIDAATSNCHNAGLLVVVATHESGLRLDIDQGLTLGDGGRACGLWQLQGVRCTDLTRAEQARIAYGRIARSFRACAGSEERFRLAAYASGSCTKGLPESAAMVDAWHRLMVR